jgi:ubiquitin C-terminal hydrolase
VKEAPKEVKIVHRPFDPLTDAKDWDSIDLGSILTKKNQKKGIVSKQVIVKTKSHGAVRIKNDVLLKLTNDIDFSMTKFDKPSKGFTNIMKVNCFMNVCLQSLFACPAFFNMTQAIIQAEAFQAKLSPDGLLTKIINVARYFDAAAQIDKKVEFAKRVVNAEQIFESFLLQYNPSSEQQDACDFLNCLLDQIHEELKPFYVP